MAMVVGSSITGARADGCGAQRPRPEQHLRAGGLTPSARPRRRPLPDRPVLHGARARRERRRLAPTMTSILSPVLTIIASSFTISVCNGASNAATNCALHCLECSNIFLGWHIASKNSHLHICKFVGEFTTLLISGNRLIAG